MFVLCVVEKRQKEEVRTVKTKTQVRKRYKERTREELQGGGGGKSWWGRGFPHPSRLPLVPTQHSIQWYRVFSTVKQPGRSVNHPLPSSAEVKERV
jgi:hypothetical protein